MAITATTLAAACGASDATVTVASATGITAPIFNAGTGITYLQVDTEIMLVLGVNGVVIQVQRGVSGSGAAAHVNGSQVQIGLPADFPPFTEFVARSLTNYEQAAGMNWPAVFLAGSADAVPAGVAAHYVVKTAGVNAMTLAAPTASQEGNIITIFSDTTNAHTLTATSLLANGTALKTTATYPAQRGAGLMLRVCNGVYHVISNGASAGVVVLT